MKLKTAILTSLYGGLAFVLSLLVRREFGLEAQALFVIPIMLGGGALGWWYGSRGR